MNQILLGASAPFLVVLMLYARAGCRASDRLLLFGPLAIGAGATWAVVPDFPRLWGSLQFYNDLHHHPHCWIWFNHCRIDKVEVDTPLWTLLFLALGITRRDCLARTAATLMAHPNLHAALGFTIGSAITMLPVARAWLRGRPMAKSFGLMLLVTYTLGVLAIVPDLLVAAGIYAGVHEIPLRDVFVLHRWLDARLGAGLLIGELILFAHFAMHYAIAWGALRRVGQ